MVAAAHPMRLQNAVFYTAKGRLSYYERRPFAVCFDVSLQATACCRQFVSQAVADVLFVEKSRLGELP